MVKEHPCTFDEPWMYSSASCKYVATARWQNEVARNETFNGPSRSAVTTKIVSAESDDLDELRLWCGEQIRNGAAIPVRIHRMGLVDAKGRRDNTFLEFYNV